MAEGVDEMELSVIEWMVRGASDEVPNAAKGVEEDVQRSADQERVSKLIMWGVGDVEHEKLRRPALPFVDIDKRVFPDTAKASINSPS